MAVSTVDVGSGYPVDCLWCASITVVGVHESLFRTVREDDGSLGIEPGIIASWETAPDLSYTDMKVQPNVMFHKGWGQMTANDVAYTYNALNTKQTPEARHDSGGEVIQLLNKVDVIDDQTARFEWANLDSTAFVRLFADTGEGIGIFSKKSFDEMGGEWMRTNIIGTGPFQMDEWVQQEGIFTSAVTDHWRQSPYVERFIYLEVPEPSARRAMLETGEAQISDVPVKDWPQLLGSNSKFAKAPEASKLSHAFPWGGNYWENTDPRPGMNNAPLTRIRHTELAWVGDPYENDPNTFDPNTESMQRSLKVRKALAMAIDRVAINDVILSGLGTPGYIGGISISDPLWAPNADRWTVPYDPDQAKQLLTEAGYPNGGFTLHWWAGLNGADIEISEAIGADWLARFNIQSEHDRRTYTTIRPSMVQRDFPVLRMHGCCMTPTDWPQEWIMSAVGIDSYNHGLEFPVATEVTLAKQHTTDPAEVKALSYKFVDFISQWQLMTTVEEIDVAPLYNRETISQWNMRPLVNNRLGGIKSPEEVKLK